MLEKDSNLKKYENNLSSREDQLKGILENNKNKLKELTDKEVSLKLKEDELTAKESLLNTKEDELNNRQAVIKRKQQQISNASSGKVAYLTFDDGPSANTAKILDILAKNNIKATFFVNGHAGYEASYLRIVNEGHKIGNHTYSHDYGQVYASVDAFNADVNKLNDFLANIGISRPDIIRFPGGSNNTVSIQYGGKSLMNSLIKEEVNKGYDYIDWNLSSGDAAGVTVDKDTIISNIENGCGGKQSVVILCHDSQYKTTTVDALQDIINYLVDQGYTFKTLEAGCAPWAKLSY